MGNLKAIMSIMQNIKPILKIISQHSGYYKEHSKSEIIEREINGKKLFIVIEKTIFKNDSDASQYVKMIAQINAKMSNVIKPPMRLFLGMFQYLKIIMELVEKKGNVKQSIATPEIITKDNQIIVIEKTAFENKDDAIFWSQILPKMNNVKV